MRTKSFFTVIDKQIQPVVRTEHELGKLGIVGLTPSPSPPVSTKYHQAKQCQRVNFEFYSSNIKKKIIIIIRTALSYKRVLFVKK